MFRAALDPRAFIRTLQGLARTTVGKFAAASAIVQGLPLVSAPIVARLYSPEAFGLYGVFYALTAILSTISLFSLNNAILNKQDEEAAFKVFLSLPAPCGIFCIFLLGGLIVVPESLILNGLGNFDRGLLLLLPLTIFFAAINTLGYTWVLRMGRYEFLARYKLILGVSTMVLQIVIGVFRLEAIGLIIANLAGYVIAGFIVLLHIYRTDQDLIRVRSKIRFFSVFRENSGLAINTTFANLINRVGSYLPELLINRFFGAAILGQYTFGMRVIGVPTAFISSTVQDVFRKEAAKEYSTTGGCVQSFAKVFQLMVGIACFFILPVVLLLPLIFPLVFGAAWSEAGALVQAVAVLIIVRFVASPLSYVWIVTGRTGLDLLWQIALVIITVAVFFGVRWLNPMISPVDLLFWFALAVGSWYVFCVGLSYRWSRTL